jgi:hypothetical protein
MVAKPSTSDAIVTIKPKETSPLRQPYFLHAFRLSAAFGAEVGIRLTSERDFHGVSQNRRMNADRPHCRMGIHHCGSYGIHCHQLEPGVSEFWPLDGSNYTHFEAPVGLIAILFFLLGMLPMWLYLRGVRWRLNRRIAMLENSLQGIAVLPTIPLLPPLPHLFPDLKLDRRRIPKPLIVDVCNDSVAAPALRIRVSVTPLGRHRRPIHYS